MRTIRALSELKESIIHWKQNAISIGFVPTMGALHEGHFALIKRSENENDITIVSIFVNPLQFNNPKDLEHYPRVVSEDLEMLSERSVDAVFIPDEKDFYPTKPIISIDFGALSERLEGQHRPGHFEGVGVVVSKLLNLVQPTRAYFGLKDLQQFLLIRQMSKDLNFPGEIVGVETVRESSGLALSSRNRRLSEKGKEAAAIINKGLNLIASGIQSHKPIQGLLSNCREFYERESNFELEYLEAVDTTSLLPIEDYAQLDELAVCVAGYVEGVRLIDNLYLRLKQ